MKAPFGNRLGKTVEEVLTSLGQGGRLAEARIMIHWGGIVGPQLASRTFPFGLSRGVLEVAVYNSVWMSQLNFFREEIARKVNTHLGSQSVSSVRLVLRKKPAWMKSAAEIPPPFRELTAAERELIEEAVAAVGDEGLADILRRVLTLQASLDRSGKEPPATR